MQPNQIVIYVASKQVSQEFYAAVLEREFADLSPYFGVFALDGGWTLALLQHDGVEPPPTPAGGTELVFPLPDRAAVDATAAAWTERGVRLIQQPVEVRFGYTFVAVDPDGNRLRVGHFPQG